MGLLIPTPHLRMQLLSVGSTAPAAGSLFSTMRCVCSPPDFPWLTDPGALQGQWQEHLAVLLPDCPVVSALSLSLSIGDWPGQRLPLLWWFCWRSSICASCHFSLTFRSQGDPTKAALPSISCFLLCLGNTWYNPDLSLVGSSPLSMFRGPATT